MTMVNNNNNGDLCDLTGEDPYATTCCSRGMFCAEEEKWACPICRDIVDDLTCEVAKSSVCCKNRCTRHRGHDPTSHTELLQRLETVESQNQDLRAQLTAHGDKIEHLQNISYEKNSILLERQETVDELTRTNSRLLYQIQNMEHKLRDSELDKMSKHQVNVNMNEKLRHLQQNLHTKDSELRSVTERLNEKSRSLEIVNEKYSQLEILLTSVYKENAQFKFELKKREIEITEKDKKLKLIPELEKKVQSLREQNKAMNVDFSLVFREYAYICSLLIKGRVSFDEVKSFAEDTFYSINSYLHSSERADAVKKMTLEYKKLLSHPKHKELTKKLEETLRVTQALIDASEQLKHDKQRLENAVQEREEKLQECIIKLKKLTFWSNHVEEQKKKVKSSVSPKKTVIFPCKFDADCQTDIQFDGATSVKFKEIVEQVVRNSNIMKLESENDELQSENLKLKDELRNTEIHIVTVEKNNCDISNLNLELKRELDELKTRCVELLEQNECKTEELEQCDELRRDAELRVNELLERPFLQERRTARKNWRRLLTNRRRNDSPLTPVLLPRHWMTERHVMPATPADVEPSVSEVELSFVQRQNVVKETMKNVCEEIAGLMQVFNTNSHQLRGKEEELKIKIENLRVIVTDILNEEIE